MDWFMTEFITTDFVLKATITLIGAIIIGVALGILLSIGIDKD
jgi:hypothetical protein